MMSAKYHETELPPAEDEIEEQPHSPGAKTHKLWSTEAGFVAVIYPATLAHDPRLVCS
jgi:hypothetical protein